MKTTFTFKRILLLTAYTVATVACNGGSSGGGAPTPQPPNLPNVFDSHSVQNIKFETKSLNGSYIDNIDLTKVGGHAAYKIQITNPNNFTMNLTEFSFSKGTLADNYYFSKNAKPDNCFNQDWYIQSAAGASLNLPANSSCSLYTTSLWLGPEQASYSDAIDYKIVNPGFGFAAKSGKRVDLWCNHDCNPIGTSIGTYESIDNDRINFSCNVLKPSNSEIINTIPSEGFSLGGDYLFTQGQATVNQLSFTRYQVSFEESQNQLRLGSSNLIYISFTSNTTPSYSGFATRKDGKFITYSFKLPRASSILSATTFQAADFINPGYDSITGQEPTTGLQGLDNELWWNSSSYIPFYQTYQMNYPLAPLSQLSPNLPASNSTILGIDADGNMVIKTGNSISCYFKQAAYLPITPVANTSTFNGLSDSVLSSKYLYTNHATLAEKFYDFNGILAPTSLNYQLDARLCQAMPQEKDGTVSYLVVPKSTSLIITDKYTLIKTSNGYTFAANSATSDGSNNLKD